jgi:ribosomal protein L36
LLKFLLLQRLSTRGQIEPKKRKFLNVPGVENFDPRHKGAARCRVSGKKTTRNGNPIQSNCSSIRREGKLYINEVLILSQAMPLPEAVWLAQQILKLPDGDPSL